MLTHNDKYFTMGNRDISKLEAMYKNTVLCTDKSLSKYHTCGIYNINMSSLSYYNYRKTCAKKVILGQTKRAGVTSDLYTIASQ